MNISYATAVVASCLFFGNCQHSFKMFNTDRALNLDFFPIMANKSCHRIHWYARGVFKKHFETEDKLADEVAFIMKSVEISMNAIIPCQPVQERSSKTVFRFPFYEIMLYIIVRTYSHLFYHLSSSRYYWTGNRHLASPFMYIIPH